MSTVLNGTLSAQNPPPPPPSPPKVLVFKSRENVHVRFTHEEGQYEIADSFIYFDIAFSRTEKFFRTKKNVYAQAAKAISTLSQIAKNRKLLADIVLHIYKAVPVMLHGCEM